MTGIVYLRDLDGTGSMHVCAKGDPGAVAFVYVGAKATFHAVDLEQCALFVDSAPLRKSMTDAAAFLRALASPEPCDLCDGRGVNHHHQLWPGRVACRACKGTGIETP